MEILAGTKDGVFAIGPDGCERLGLAGRRVTHVTQRPGAGERLALAAVPRDGLYALTPDGERRVFEGDVRSCAVGPDGALFAGVEPAMIHRSDDGGASWQRLDAIDRLPTRGEWTFPPLPHEPHVLSIDFLPDDPASVLAGVEVGGVLLSRDGGRSWQEINAGVYVDVHSVRPDPSRPGQLLAVTGRGFYASEDAGESWERRMNGVGNGYTIGMHIHPKRAGEVLLSSGDRPPGLNGRLYHSSDAGKSWVELAGEGLPRESPRAAVPLFAADAAWLGTGSGQLLRADDPRGRWSLACELPAPIHALAAEGRPSSVMH